MDMLNKLKSTVTTTVSQLSGVLPGNPVTREYEVGKLIGSAGPDLLWRIYAGVKKSTRQEAAIFVLEKKLLDKYPKKDKENITEVLKKGIAQLTRLRHPQILTVQHALEESRESLAFATEPVFASLANILGNHDNISPVPQQLRDYKLFEVEIKYGLQQLTEGLVFLHNDVKLLHCNLCPESIVVNQQGAFKIFGFDFCNTSQEAGGKIWPVKEPDPELPPVAQPNLDFLAPEIGRNPRRHGNGANTINCGSSSDMYSLGCIIRSIYHGGESPWKMEGDVESFFRHAASHNAMPRLDQVPKELVDQVRLLLHPNPEQRPDAHQLVKISFFDDVGVKTLNYLDSLFQWDNLQKSQFFKGLPQILPRLPQRVCLHRVMPCLAKEFVNPSMVPFILPCALLIAQEASKESYVAHILPHLKPVMKIQDPIQVLLIFMKNMELLLQKTPAEDVKSDVLPMIYRALEAEAAPQIQELCLSVIPSFASLIDYPAMKNALMPRIKKLCQLPGSQLSVRVNCLLCIGKLLDNVDKWLVLDDILPMLPTIPSKDPAVLMAILGVYKIALEHPRLGIPKEVLATQIIPFLYPMVVEPSLSLSQFRALTSTIKDMMGRVEEEQKNKLESLAAIQEEQRTALGHLSMDAKATSGGATSGSSGSGSNSASSAAVSEQIEALFAQLSTSDVGNKQASPVSATKRIDTAVAPLAPPVASSTAGQTYKPQSSSTSSSSSSSMMTLRPTPAPSASAWNSNQNGTSMSNKDPVSSMMMSNLTNLSAAAAAPPPRPNLQWGNQPAVQGAFSPGWGQQTAGPIPTGMPLQQQQQPQQQPMMMQPMRMASPMVPQSLSQPFPPLGSGAPAVRPLARADIDDLLS